MNPRLLLNTKWDEADRVVIMQHNAKHWERWKHENRWTRVDEIPGFADSLRSLIVDQGYSQSDVATFFGVSRERMRQWLVQFGIEQPSKGSKVRRFDWELGRFVTCAAADMQEDRTAARAAAKVRRHEVRRTEHVATLRGLAARLGRTPFLKEFLVEADTSVPAIAPYWGRPIRSRANADLAPYTEYLDALWAAAGMRRPHLEDWHTFEGASKNRVRRTR